ncbi:MAG: right-handed parallel beta-helix repeat-containing protein, partial [bacterium]|nr:right-handed parallel beta-helix repeat-containing protein [bacterium]
MKLKIFIPLLALIITSIFAVTLHAVVINVNGNVSDGSGEEDQGPWVSGNTYIVQTSATVPVLQTLTIGPGVIIEFTVTTQAFTVNGKLAAGGTAAERITFKPASGLSNWQRLFFNGADAGTILDNCDIISAGSGGNPSLYLYNTGINVNVSNCKITGGGGPGISVGGTSSPGITGTEISGCAGDGINITSALKVTVTDCIINNNGGDGIDCGTAGTNAPNAPVIDGTTSITNNAGYCLIIPPDAMCQLGDITISGNGPVGNANKIFVNAGTITINNSLWKKFANVPSYLVGGSITINDGVTNTIPAGQTLEFTVATAAFTVNGKLAAGGTAAERITFKPASGLSNWQRLF